MGGFLGVPLVNGGSDRGFDGFLGVTGGYGGGGFLTGVKRPVLNIGGDRGVGG